jgi:hypothetical protein
MKVVQTIWTIRAMITGRIFGAFTTEKLAQEFLENQLNTENYYIFPLEVYGEEIND